MNPEVLYQKFLEKVGGDVRTAVMMVWAVAEVTEIHGVIPGYGPIWLWWNGRGRNLLAGLEKKAA